MSKLVVIALYLLAFALGNPNTELECDGNDNLKIVGGTDAPEGEYPFIVSLRSPSKGHFCGGSILNTRWILTAAHCLAGRMAYNTMVVAGTNTLNSGGITFTCSLLTIHTEFDSKTYEHDIAVIQLDGALTYTSKIKPVVLSTANTGATAAILIGWGRTTNGGNAANNLQKLPTKTMVNQECKESWGSFIGDDQICTYVGADKGACGGDSGSPLLDADKNQIGIASFILEGGCAQDFPDVFVRVSSYTKWIAESMDKAS